MAMAHPARKYDTCTFVLRVCGALNEIWQRRFFFRFEASRGECKRSNRTFDSCHYMCILVDLGHIFQPEQIEKDGLAERYTSRWQTCGFWPKPDIGKLHYQRRL